MTRCQIDLSLVQTNMVYVGFPEEKQGKLIQGLQDEGILVCAGNPMRLVTHMDISLEDIHKTVEVFAEILG